MQDGWRGRLVIPIQASSRSGLRGAAYLEYGALKPSLGWDVKVGRVLTSFPGW